MHSLDNTETVSIFGQSDCNGVRVLDGTAAKTVEQNSQAKALRYPIFPRLEGNRASHGFANFLPLFM